MPCNHRKVYIHTFEEGRILWICSSCRKTGSEIDDASSDRNFDHEQYFRLLSEFNDAARDRAHGTQPS